MIRLESFTQSDFDRLISWVDTQELLVTIAGTDFTFPLTSNQLLKYLQTPKSHPLNLVDILKSKVIGHAQILVRENGLCKIDKLLIGDKSIRGQGIGQAAINALLHYSFENLNAAVVELNVFDWNIAGIKCYEKCGFIKNESQTQTFRMESSIWTAFNMRIDKSRWQELKGA